ncbi:hypothetical protein HDU84_002116 [Entophlyctis sp. JEL0112]|nr:hypothetical protein HDU84_002116 [Entophlyctis sp. JEL0112]
MQEFLSAPTVYVRRAPLDGEDPDENVLPSDLDLGRASGGDRSDEHDFRLVSDLPDNLTFTVDLRAGGTEWIYGMLVVDPFPTTSYSKLVISCAFCGKSSVVAPDPRLENGQVRMFCDIETVILSESSSLHHQPRHSSLSMVPLPFVIPITTPPAGLPFSFQSKSCSISYSLNFKFNFWIAKAKNYITRELVVPVVVTPPWTTALPPETPRLAAGDNGVRMVFDANGQIQGNLSVLRSDDAPTQFADIVLRPKVLSNMRKNGDRSAAGIRSAPVLTSGHGVGSGVGDVNLNPNWVLEFEAGVPEYTLLDPVISGGQRLQVHTEFGESSDTKQPDSAATITVADTPRPGPLNFTQFVESNREIQEVGPDSVVDTFLPEGYILEFHQGTELRSGVTSPPLPYSPFDPLPARMPVLTLDPVSSAFVPLPSLQYETYTEPVRDANTPSSVSQSKPAEPEKRVNFFKSLLNRITISSSPVPSFFRSPQEASPAADFGTFGGSRTSPIPQNLAINVGGTPTPAAIPAAAAEGLSATVRTEAYSQTSRGEGPAHNANDRAGSVHSAGSSARDGPRRSLEAVATAAVAGVARRVSLEAKTPKFKIVMPRTMMGPSTRVPIDVYIKSLPRRHVLKRIECVLMAHVRCTAHGVPLVDEIELSRGVLNAGEGEAVGDVGFTDREGSDGDGGECVMKRRMWLTVPDPDQLLAFGVQFEAPLIRLQHKIQFWMYTEKVRRFASPAKGSYNLGGISVVLMR